jgi:hypothetical protein
LAVGRARSTETAARVVDFEAFRAELEQTIDEIRDAVRDVVARGNAEWLIEKNG